MGKSLGWENGIREKDVAPSVPDEANSGLCFFNNRKIIEPVSPQATQLGVHIQLIRLVAPPIIT